MPTTSSGRLSLGRTLRLAFAVLAASALLAMLAVPANAHRVIVPHPRDPSYAVMLEDHRSIYACDQQSDGNRAYLRYYVSGIQQPALYDPDGAGGNCGGTPINPLTLDSFNICVQNEGCGSPYYWWQGY